MKLRDSVARGAMFTLAARWSDQLIGFVSTIILARLLVPDDIGIIVQYAEGQVTVQRNQISGAAADAGIWLYHNSDKASPVLARQNSLSSAGSSSANAGEGVGIFLTDDGDLFGDEDGDSYAAIGGNTITGFVRGIDLYRNGTSPAGGRNVVATIGGALPGDGPPGFAEGLRGRADSF